MGQMQRHTQTLSLTFNLQRDGTNAKTHKHSHSLVDDRPSHTLPHMTITGFQTTRTSPHSQCKSAPGLISRVGGDFAQLPA